ncbi:MAG: hypothetical protein HOW73_46315 [Polyangiaceae bacterium]|nr:hypothetical protein [Polyangiaceae bacterium]
MAEPELRFDASASQVVVQTRAKGMLAKLAHDLSIDARDASATLRIEGEEAVVELRVPVAKLEVAGVLKGGDIDRGVLSRSDKDDIQKKIREEVLRSGEVVVAMRASVGGSPIAAGKRSADARGRIEVGGRSAQLVSRADIDATDTRVTANGRVKVNLPALGITPPKGPLGAFRVDDDVEIVYRLAFGPA